MLPLQNLRGKNRDAPEYKYFKNYNGSSSGMDILVEGFKKSEEMHGLQYISFVSDGDSSVYAKLKENMSYGKNLTKAEVKNKDHWHAALMKNMGFFEIALMANIIIYMK